VHTTNLAQQFKQLGIPFTVVCTRAVVVIHRVRWRDILIKRCVTLGFKFQLLPGKKRFCICIDVTGLREHKTRLG